MARLTTAQRKKLPSSTYALPGKKFPMPDKAHAIAAERLVGRSVKAGNITPAQAAIVKRKAKAKLGKTGPVSGMKNRLAAAIKKYK
jgi:hypothetical protein